MSAQTPALELPGSHHPGHKRARQLRVEADKVRMKVLTRQLVHGDLASPDPRNEGGAGAGSAGPLSPSLRSPGAVSILQAAAQAFLEDIGETTAARGEITMEEKAFLAMCSDVTERVTNVRSLLSGIDASVGRRTAELKVRQLLRDTRTGPLAAGLIPGEKFCFEEYHEWLRDWHRRSGSGVANDELEVIGEGNLLPILAVLEGNAEALERHARIRRGKKVRNVAGYLVEVDSEEEEAIHGGNSQGFALAVLRSMSRSSQTETLTEKSLFAETVALREEATQLRTALDARDRRLTELDYFRETASRRLPALRDAIAALHQEQEQEVGRLTRMLGAALLQNQHLVDKLNALVSAASHDERGAEALSFAQAMGRVRQRQALAQRRTEAVERLAMGLQDRMHLIQAGTQDAIERVRKSVVPGLVEEAVALIRADAAAATPPSLSGATAAVAAPVSTPPGSPSKASSPRVAPPLPPGGAQGTQLHDMLRQTLGSDLLPYFSVAADDCFRAMDFATTTALKEAARLAVSMQETRRAVGAAKELRELIPNVRNAVFDFCSDVARVAADNATRQRQQQQMALGALMEQHERTIAAMSDEHLAAQERAKQARAAQRRKPGTRDAETLTDDPSTWSESDPRAVVASRSFSRLQRSSSGRLDAAAASAAAAAPRLPPFVYPATVPYDRPADVIQIVLGYLTEMVSEVVVSCRCTGGPQVRLPSRVETVYPLLAILRGLQKSLAAGPFRQLDPGYGSESRRPSADPGANTSTSSSGKPKGKDHAKLSKSESSGVAEWWAAAEASVAQHRRSLAGLAERRATRDVALEEAGRILKDMASLQEHERFAHLREGPAPAAAAAVGGSSGPARAVGRVDSVAVPADGLLAATTSSSAAGGPRRSRIQLVSALDVDAVGESAFSNTETTPKARASHKGRSNGRRGKGSPSGKGRGGSRQAKVSEAPNRDDGVEDSTPSTVVDVGGGSRPARRAQSSEAPGDSAEDSAPSFSNTALDDSRTVQEPKAIEAPDPDASAEDNAKSAPNTASGGTCPTHDPKTSEVPDPVDRAEDSGSSSSADGVGVTLDARAAVAAADRASRTSSADSEGGLTHASRRNRGVTRHTTTGGGGVRGHTGRANGGGGATAAAAKRSSLVSANDKGNFADSKSAARRATTVGTKQISSGGPGARSPPKAMSPVGPRRSPRPPSTPPADIAEAWQGMQAVLAEFADLMPAGLRAVPSASPDSNPSSALWSATQRVSFEQPVVMIRGDASQPTPAPQQRLSLALPPLAPTTLPVPSSTILPLVALDSAAPVTPSGVGAALATQASQSPTFSAAPPQKASEDGAGGTFPELLREAFEALRASRMSKFEPASPTTVCLAADSRFATTMRFSGGSADAAVQVGGLDGDGRGVATARAEIASTCALLLPPPTQETLDASIARDLHAWSLNRVLATRRVGAVAAAASAARAASLHGAFGGSPLATLSLTGGERTLPAGLRPSTWMATAAEQAPGTASAQVELDLMPAVRRLKGAPPGARDGKQAAAAESPVTGGLVVDATLPFAEVTERMDKTVPLATTPQGRLGRGDNWFERQELHAAATPQPQMNTLPRLRTGTHMKGGSRTQAVYKT